LPQSPQLPGFISLATAKIGLPPCEYLHNGINNNNRMLQLLKIGCKKNTGSGRNVLEKKKDMMLQKNIIDSMNARLMYVSK
jgi:hypothetical protein